MIKDKKDYSNPDLDTELNSGVQELIELLTESNKRCKAKLDKQTKTLVTLLEMRK